MSGSPTFDTEKKTRNGGILRLRLAYGRRSNKENSIVTQTLYLHVHRFEALPSINCIGISRGQVIKVLRHKIVVL